MIVKKRNKIKWKIGSTKIKWKQILMGRSKVKKIQQK